MEYGDGDDYPGTVPEYGAIFMSNMATQKECLDRKLLGLPSGQANFVSYVKAGMILFLFEFEKRELHGVYRACSDGAMNIVPRAFKSSGKQFPAQVRFSVIWDCKPLSEHEFRDAISENYYSNKKFNFGLSDDQVRRLLCLFSSRKLKNRVPRRQYGGETLICKEESISENKKFSSRKRGENLIEEYIPTDPINIEYNPNSTSENKRSDDKRFRENSLGYDRVERVVEDDMDLTDNQIEIGDNNYHNLRDSFYSSRRQSQDNQFLNFDTVDIEHTANEITPNRIEDFLARARRDSDDDDRFQLRDLKGNKNIPIDDHFQLRKPVERLDIPQTEFRTLIDDQMLLTNQVSNPFAKVRRTSDDDGQHYINNKIEIGQTMDNNSRPIVSNRLHEVERGSDDQRQFSYEPFSTSLHYGENPNFQDRFSRTISMERRNLDDNNSLDPITSPMHSEHFLNRLKPSDDYYKLQNSRGEKAYSVGNNVGPPRCADLYQLTQQPSLHSSKPMMEAHYSLSQNHHKTSTEQNKYGKSYQTCFTTKKNNYEVSKPTYHDSVLTRTSSYEQGFPPDVNGSSCSVQDFVAVTKSVKNSSYASTEKSLSQSNGASLVSEIPLHNDEDLYGHPHQRLSKSVLRGGCHKEEEQPSINHEIYENPLLFSRSPIYERGTLSPSIEFDEHTIASKGLSSHYFQDYVNDPQFSDDQDLMVNYGMGRAHSSSNTCGIGSYEDVNEPDQNPLRSKKRRASVFARLSVSRSEQEHGNYMEYGELDASIDQVMESLFESLSHKVTDATNQSPLVEEYDTEESDMRYNQIEVDEPTMMTQKIKTKSTPAIENEENDKDAPIETRVMDFKRRSESKRSRDGEKTKGSLQKSERKREGEGEREEEKEGKQIKRRKLVRPSFCVKEELNENNKGDGFSDSELLLTHEYSNGVVSGQSIINPNCPSPNSQANRKLVKQVLVKKKG